MSLTALIPMLLTTLLPTSLSALVPMFLTMLLPTSLTPGIQVLGKVQVLHDIAFEVTIAIDRAY